MAISTFETLPPPPRMRWSGATGAIARCKRVSTGCGRKRRSVRAWRWICGVKRKPKAVNKLSPHFIVHGLDKPGGFTTVSIREQGFLRNHAIPQFTFLTPVGNRCITPYACVKEPSRSRGVIPTAGGLYVHKGTVCCRNIRRHIQRYWILRRLCRSISC